MFICTFHKWMFISTHEIDAKSMPQGKLPLTENDLSQINQEYYE